MADDWRSGSGSHAGSDLPRHYCAECSAVRHADDPRCADCDRPRPAAGWVHLDETYDSFLGRVLNGQYFVTKVEGWGNGSTVYRAEATNVPKRFAVKTIELFGRKDDEVAALRERIEREVRAVGMLRNPHIVRVYELLEIEGRWIALVMDHVEGQTLEALVEREGPLDLWRAAHLGRQVANCLCEAHQSKMIHRDVKPSNIMVERLPDGRDFAYVLDFGIVHLADEARMTQDFLGTPLYASPEQAAVRPVDHRSDIYSLGATLFYAMCGRPPFEGRRGADVLMAHLHEKPPRLGEVVGQPVPPMLESLISRMLAKRPDDRPDDLFEVMEVLDEVGHMTDPPSDVEIEEVPQASVSDLGLGRDSSELGDEHTEMGRPGQSALEGPLLAADADETASVSATAQGLGVATSGFERHAHRSEVHTRDTGGFERPQTDPNHLSAPRHLAASESVAFSPAVPATDAGAAPQATAIGGLSDASVVQLGFASHAFAAAADHRVVSADSRRGLWIADGADAEQVGTAPSEVGALALSSRLVFFGQDDGTVAALSLRSGRSRVLFQDVRRAPMTALAVSRGGKVIVAGSQSGRLYLAKGGASEAGWRRIASGAAVTAVALSSAGDTYAAARADGDVVVGNVDSPQTTVARFSTDSPARSLAFSNDGHLLAIATATGAVHVYQVLYGRRISTIEQAFVPEAIYFSSDDVLHGVCQAADGISRWNLMRREPVLMRS